MLTYQLALHKLLQTHQHFDELKPQTTRHVVITGRAHVHRTAGKGVTRHNHLFFPPIFAAMSKQDRIKGKKKGNKFIYNLK